jgi:hypothetical protein
MMILPPSLIEFNTKLLEDIDRRVKTIYRLIIFDTDHHNSDLLTRYLEAMEHLRDVLSIKNAQQEAQSHEEAVLYLDHLKEGLSLIVDEIAAQRTLGKPADLFMLMRAIAPEAIVRSPNQFRQTIVQFGQCNGADPKDIPHLVDQLFLALEEISHPVIRGIYLHHELVRIHPFVDGNGRLARLAKNWLLMFDLYPPMFINSFSQKQSYISKLEQSFMSISDMPDSFSEQTRLFFEDEMLRLRASAGFVLRRMLKDPDFTFDSMVDTTSFLGEMNL